ncbi:MAG: DUF373 family protein [Nitrososphaerales archaeon]
MSADDYKLSSIESDERDASRLLIVCIDRDNDVEVKTGIKTPMVGREACMNAAMKLALADPEEADANAIFGAVREYDDLLEKGEHCEVMVAGGLFERGVLGDKKIRKEIADTLAGFPAEGIVVVSDGLEGEELVPVIQGLAPIVSIRRIVIKHSRSVEESYAVLGRYFRMLLFDPRYARYALGIPGIIFVGFVMIYAIYPPAATLVLTIFIGIVFIIRGFDIDRKIESIGKLSATGLLRLFSIIVSILVILVGIATGISVFFVSCASTGSSTEPCIIAKTIVANPQAIVLNAPKIAGYFILNSEIFIWLGFAVYITTTIFFNLLRPKSRHVVRYLVELSVLGLLYFPVSIFASTLITPRSSNDLFIAIVMFALAGTYSIAAYIYSLNKRRRETQLLEVPSE